MNEVKLKDTKEYQNLPFRGRWAIDNIIEYTQELAADKEKLNKQIEALSNFQPGQKLKPYIPKPTIWEEETDFWGVKRDAKGYVVYKPVKKPEDLQEWLKLNEPIYKENVVICENNVKAIQLAFAFFKKLGIPEEKYDYPSNRSKNKVKLTCSWVTELRNAFPTSCDYSWQQDKRWVEEESKKINEYYDKKKREEEAVKKAEEEKLKEQEKISFIIRLVQKYNLTFTVPIPEPDDVLSEILKKNKYLYLAHYMMKNRGDWNDGCSYAETGLNFFIGQNDEIKSVNDSEIYEDVNSYILNWDGDGRVFRDCDWNYDRLFSVVGEQKPELLADFRKLQDYCPI